jgi:hypothetical protein
MMVAMGAAGLGFAGFKLFKTAKEKIKGYRETKAEKKANREAGVEIPVKKINPDTGEEYEVLVPLSKSDSNLDADGVEKKRKELQKKYDNLEKSKDKGAANAKIRAALGKGPNDIITKDDQKKGMAQLKDPEETEKAEKEKGEKKKATERKPAKYWVGKERGEGGIPKSKEPKVRGLEAKAIKDGNGVLDWQDKWETEDTPTGWTKVKDPEGDEDDFEYKKTADVEAEREKNKQNTGGGSSNGAGQGTTTGKKTNGALKTLAKDQGLSSQRILNFGEFITEGVMNDLLKAGKSKKDSEITLDDGADIPIDPLTSQILVKYIEGLSSSEKNRTIQQIQRTERAFMKVLGKAHENT